MSILHEGVVPLVRPPIFTSPDPVNWESLPDEEVLAGIFEEVSDEEDVQATEFRNER